MADGAAVTGDGFKPLYLEGENETHDLVARTVPGADRAALERRFHQIGRDAGRRTPRRSPVEVARLEQVDRVPVALAVMLGRARPRSRSGTRSSSRCAGAAPSSRC